MKTLYNKLHIFGQTMLLVFFTLSVPLFELLQQRNVGLQPSGCRLVCQAVEGWQIFYPKSGWIE